NRFDPYAFAAQARLRGADPRGLLDRVFVSRAFTIHQLEAVVETMMAPLVPGPGGQMPMMAVLGLDHLFLEESLPVAERRLVLGRVVAGLGGIGARAKVLITHEPPPPGQRWWGPMLAMGTFRARLTRADGGGFQFRVARLT